MRHLLLRSLAALACFGIFGLPQTSAAPTPDQSDKPDFSGTWTLDPKASVSLEPLIKENRRQSGRTKIRLLGNVESAR
jgi:hypothetical protein